MTPRQSSTGGKPRLGRITKMGDRYLRKLLVVGACATLRHRKGHNDALRLWASGMLERKTVKYKFKLTAVALANKVARIVFVLMARGEVPAAVSVLQNLLEQNPDFEMAYVTLARVYLSTGRLREVTTP